MNMFLMMEFVTGVDFGGCGSGGFVETHSERAHPRKKLPWELPYISKELKQLKINLRDVPITSVVTYVIRSR